ncbi:hypothetical protein N9D09_00960 [bacterium]|nr:hypothetical protein [bacterium]
MAHELTKKYDIECILIDYADGYMASRANKDLVDVVYYSDDFELSICDDAIIVFQSMTPWSIFPMLHVPDKTKILFWNCHPQNLVPTLPGMRVLDRIKSPILRNFCKLLLSPYMTQTKKFVTHLLATKGLVFMDRENVRNTESCLGLHITDPSYIPIPSTSANPVSFPINSLNETPTKIRLSWVGRIVDFKYFILKKLLFDLEAVSGEINLDITMTIIGDGSHHFKLTQDIAELAKIDIKLIHHLEESILDDFLRNETDILFAMGTSALEGAKFGIPTILLDLAFTEVPSGYQYQWLYERDGSTLGDIIADCKDDSSSVSSLKSIFTRWLEQENELSDLTLEYFNQNHDISVVAHKFTHALESCCCVWGDLKSKGLLRRGVAYPVFKLLRK